MRVQVFVVSSSDATCECVGRLKEKAIPPDIVKKLASAGLRPVVRALKLHGADYDDIASSMINLSHDEDDVVALLHHNVGRLAEFLSPHILSHPLTDDITQNPKNYLNRGTSNLLKKYFAAKQRFSDLGIRKLMMLPRKNCAAAELERLLELSAHAGSLSEFSDVLDRNLALLRQRMTPKKKTRDPSSYFKDDEGLHFQFGHEQHASASDSCPPHNPGCVLGVHFRMGMRLDRKQHYNVTEEDDYISGAFVDCHEATKLVKSTTHLNMFPNGQF